MSASRAYHTATSLPSGKMLVAGGRSWSVGPPYVDLATAELYDPESGTWTQTNSMSTAREIHTATLLPSGKVLVVGGVDLVGGRHASAELYDPASSTWSPTGSMAASRWRHTATLLPSGKVLVAGGYTVGGTVATAELYDPQSGTWTQTGSMATSRGIHTATLLRSGKVLVAGGLSTSTGPLLASAELYDAATGTWSQTGSMAYPHYVHTATLLGSGKVLVVDGDGPPSTTISAELYDPLSGTWNSAGRTNVAHSGHTATMLSEGSSRGRVLVAGGTSGGTYAHLFTAELYLAPNEAPVAVPDAFITDEDTALTVAAPGVLVNDTDADSDALSATLVQSPAHGTVTLNADGSFTYVPDANYNGSDQFTYFVSDGQASSTAEVTITVNPVNDVPTPSDDAYSTNKLISLTVTAPGVLGNDVDVDGDALRAVLVAAPTQGTLVLNGDGSFSYTARANGSGSDSFTYKATDGVAESGVATVSIAIVIGPPLQPGPPPDPPAGPPILPPGDPPTTPGHP